VLPHAAASLHAAAQVDISNGACGGRPLSTTTRRASFQLAEEPRRLIWGRWGWETKGGPKLEPPSSSMHAIEVDGA